MKVIATDNFDRDYIADELIEENVTQEYGKKMVEELNKVGGLNSQLYYMVVEDDYKLHEIEY